MWKALVLTAVLALSNPAPLGAEPAPKPKSDAATYVGVTDLSPREYAKRASRSRTDYACLVKLWQRESGWNHKADNPNSSAYGIAQMLGETSKSPYRQIDKGLRYIKHRYGNACAAWSHWLKHRWY